MCSCSCHVDIIFLALISPKPLSMIFNYGYVEGLLFGISRRVSTLFGFGGQAGAAKSKTVSLIAADQSSVSSRLKPLYLEENAFA